MSHIKGWTSPRLCIRFALTGETLAIFDPRGQPFLSSVALAARIRRETARAEQERARAEQEAASAAQERARADHEAASAQQERERAESGARTRRPPGRAAARTGYRALSLSSKGRGIGRLGRS
jgi:hypothetical protein